MDKQSLVLAIVTRVTCCIAFLIIVAVWAAMCIHTWTWVIPEWEILVVGSTLMGYSISSLFGNLSLRRK